MYSEKQMKPPARNRLPVIAQKSQALSASQRNSDRIKDHGCSDFSETSQLPNHDMSEPQKLQASLPSPLLWSFMHIPRNKHPDEKTPKHGWEKFKGNSQRLSSYFFPIPYPISAVLANVGYVKKDMAMKYISSKMAHQTSKHVKSDRIFSKNMVLHSIQWFMTLSDFGQSPNIISSFV